MKPSTAYNTNTNLNTLHPIVVVFVVVVAAVVVVVVVASYLENGEDSLGVEKPQHIGTQLLQTRLQCFSCNKTKQFRNIQLEDTAIGSDCNNSSALTIRLARSHDCVFEGSLSRFKNCVVLVE